MIRIDLSEAITHAAPDLHVLAIECAVRNSEPDAALWKEILAEEEGIRQGVKMEEINKWSPIAATRTAYKSLGKEPNRYRPSAESLRRRVVKGLSLYKIDTLVDLINLVSLHTGYSIGGFDRDKIEGGELVLGVGKEGELYHGIGRGGTQHCRASRLSRCRWRDRNTDQRRGTHEDRIGNLTAAHDYQRIFRIGGIEGSWRIFPRLVA